MNIPENYRSGLDIRQTQIAIKEVKDHFERTDYYRFVARIMKTRTRRWLQIHFGF